MRWVFSCIIYHYLALLLRNLVFILIEARKVRIKKTNTEIRNRDACHSDIYHLKHIELQGLAFTNTEYFYMLVTPFHLYLITVQLSADEVDMPSPVVLWINKIVNKTELLLKSHKLIVYSVQFVSALSPFQG